MTVSRAVLIIALPCVGVAIIISIALAYRVGLTKGKSAWELKRNLAEWSVLIRRQHGDLSVDTTPDCTSSSCGHAKLLSIWRHLDKVYLLYERVSSESGSYSDSPLSTDPRKYGVQLLPMLNAILDSEAVTFEEYLVLQQKEWEVVEAQLNSIGASSFSRLSMDRPLKGQISHGRWQFDHEPCRQRIVAYLNQSKGAHSLLRSWLASEGPDYLRILRK